VTSVDLVAIAVVHENRQIALRFSALIERGKFDDETVDPRRESDRDTSKDSSHVSSKEQTSPTNHLSDFERKIEKHKGEEAPQSYSFQIPRDDKPAAPQVVRFHPTV